MQKLNHITEREWCEVCDFNRFIWEDFLTNSAELSPQTRKVYHSNLKIWFVWVKDSLNNKAQTDIKPLEYKRFQNWLLNRGCSYSDICNKRAAISSLNNYIEIYYQSEYPTFRNFINKSIKRPPKANVYEKQPLSKAEYAHLIDVLTEREDWQRLAYLKFTFETGCRRAESRQLTKDAVNLKPIVRSKTIVDSSGNENVEEVVVYQTKPIRCKGAGEIGKVRKLTVGKDAMDALKKWVEARGGLDGDDCPYMFVTHQNGVLKQISESGFNSWSKKVFEPIVGRRFHPHMLRSSRASQAVLEDKKDIHSVQKLLGHEDASTTEIYVVRHDEDDVDDLF